MVGGGRVWASGALAVALIVSAGLFVLVPGETPGRTVAGPVPEPPCPTVDLKKTPEPGPQQSHPAPRPTESCGVAAARLTGVVSTFLGVPATFAWNTKRLQYETLAEFPDGKKLQVRILAGHEYPARRSDSQCPDLPELDCTYEVTGDRTVVITNDHGQGMQADAYRTDGTSILVLANAGAISRERLAELAGDPGLTLFPR
jgi:hypothetical protein